MNPKGPETWFSGAQLFRFLEPGMLLVLNDFSYDHGVFYTWQTRLVDGYEKPETVRAKSCLVLEITALDEPYPHQGFLSVFLPTLAMSM